MNSTSVECMMEYSPMRGPLSKHMETQAGESSSQHSLECQVTIVPTLQKQLQDLSPMKSSLGEIFHTPTSPRPHQSCRPPGDSVSMFSTPLLAFTSLFPI